jgi:endonuclease/exonuclease/phosphatase family metal-dependent hydrolase
MPYYKYLEAETPTGRRSIERLLKLREQLGKEIPQKSAEKTLLLATWNIREFDSPAYGERSWEALYYIAEIIAHFDLVAVQEVRNDLTALNRLLSILGNDWTALFSDVTEGKQGNNERMAFVYDRRKVQFGGLMGQLILPPDEQRQRDSGEITFNPVKQLVRAPLICGFKVGWTDFILTTVHIIYGENKANSPARLEEIKQLAETLKRRGEDPTGWSRNYILLGDFNIYAPSDVTMQALTAADFVVPEQLQNLPSNIAQNKFYDQIAFRARPGKFMFTGKAGVFDYYKTVYRIEDEALYQDTMGESYVKAADGGPRANPSLYYTNFWRTHQMSDHLPMWVEMQVDFTETYLEGQLET